MPATPLQISSPVRQRGAVAAIVAAGLAFVLLLAVAYANRNVLVEQRIAANQQRATQAFEAAEAGLAWALARLADPRPAGPDCRPAASGPTFRERFASPAGLAAAQTPACVRSDHGWRCACPPDGDAAALAGSGDARAAFRLQLRDAGRPDQLQVLATGCAGTLAACDAVARSESLVAWLAPVARLPAAALTARGSIAAGSAAIGAHHASPASGGLTLHAGGTIDAAQARLTPPAGSLRAESVFAGDAVAAGLDGDRFFALHLGTARDAWRQRAVRVACAGGDCAPLLQQAIDDAHAQAVWVDGDLQLETGITLGSPQRPLALVVDGAVRIRGDVAIHGLLYAGALEWTAGTGPAARVHGATLVEGDARIDAPVDFIHDAAVLGRLQQQAATPVPVPGGWRDH